LLSAPDMARCRLLLVSNLTWFAGADNAPSSLKTLASAGYRSGSRFFAAGLFFASLMLGALIGQLL